MLKSFKKHIESNLEFLKEAKLLLAVSGGLDSCVLAYLSHALNLNIALVHCNFNLRGEESDADEQFVLDLAEELELEVFIESFDTEEHAKTSKLSIQMAARDLRYKWFKELADQLHFDYILTAHHADDNLETFLINLSRGTGLDGLTGIPEQNEKLIRPLLPFSREQIETFAQQQNIQWREDASNTSEKYLRNALRHKVIPPFKELNPQLLQNLQKTLSYLQDAQLIIKDRMKEVEAHLISKRKDGVLQLNIAELKKLSNPKAYLYQLLKTYGFKEWNDISDLLDAQSGKQLYSDDFRLLKDRKTLILSPKANVSKEKIEIQKGQSRVKLLNGTLFFDEADAIFGKRTNSIYVDKDLLKFPLIVRPWREGDYFYPLGMKGRKKLSKYFKDEKLSLLDKEHILLLCSGNDIIWILNKRADNRFKVTDATKHILKITFEA